MYICCYCFRIFKNSGGLGSHSPCCKNNSDRIKRKRSPESGRKKGCKAWNKGLTKETNKSIFIQAEKLRGRPGNFLGKKHTEKSKEKISNAMKKAHKEGRAWNLGNNRWKNEPSYPEKFFMNVIENEIDNKNYEYNMYFNGFWLDFAWPELKKCIEIDGKQHQDNSQQKERDRRKEILLKENGWELLRISWQEMFNDTKFYIEKSKSFVDH